MLEELLWVLEEVLGVLRVPEEQLGVLEEVLGVLGVQEELIRVMEEVLGVLGILEELIRVIEEVLGVLGGRVRGGVGSWWYGRYVSYLVLPPVVWSTRIPSYRYAVSHGERKKGEGWKEKERNGSKEERIRNEGWERKEEKGRRR